MTNGTIFRNRYLEVSNGQITYVGKTKNATGKPVYEVENGYICPGFIDIHIHGIDGFDFMDNEKDVFKEISKKLPKYGVTSYLATSRTAPPEDIRRFLEKGLQYSSNGKSGAKMSGVHLEGPWISKKYSGAHDKNLVRELTSDDLQTMIEPYSSIIKMITLAPEKMTDPFIISYLKQLGIVVSAGHTNATFEEINRAIRYGLSHFTHTFNAMSPIHHRKPGAAASALYNKEVTADVIVDGEHVDFSLIELVYRLKTNEKLVLISDCTGYNHLSSGNYHMRGKDLVKYENKITLKDGTLAGSIITLDKSLRYMVNKCHVPLEKAVYMITEGPRNALGLSEKIGALRKGYAADFVIVDADLQVEKTCINGELMYRNV